ncbi:MAG: hypothetical protein AAF483_19480 [Planctomycetota bacterium]
MDCFFYGSGCIASITLGLVGTTYMWSKAYHSEQREKKLRVRAENAGDDARASEEKTKASEEKERAA